VPSAVRISVTHVSEMRSSSFWLGHTARKALYFALLSARFSAAVSVAMDPALTCRRLTTTTLPGGQWTLGDITVSRFGYGAMQLAGPWVMGPPADREGAVAVLRDAVALGITHLDTRDAYGPRVTNDIIREALHPYPDSLHIATKVGGTRDAHGGWPTARTPDELRRQVRENLDALGLETLDLVNLRLGNAEGPVAEPIAESFGTLVELQREGLDRHLGVSNATTDQVVEAMSISPIVMVQNMYNLAYRQDDALIDRLAGEGIAYVPFFPLGGFSPLNILLIPGTSSAAHLRHNVSGAGVTHSADDIAELNAIGG